MTFPSYYNSAFDETKKSLSRDFFIAEMETCRQAGRDSVRDNSVADAPEFPRPWLTVSRTRETSLRLSYLSRKPSSWLSPLPRSLRSLRRWRDSNSRGLAPYSLSKRAHSATMRHLHLRAFWHESQSSGLLGFRQA